MIILSKFPAYYAIRTAEIKAISTTAIGQPIPPTAHEAATAIIPKASYTGTMYLFCISTNFYLFVITIAPVLSSSEYQHL